MKIMHRWDSLSNNQPVSFEAILDLVSQMVPDIALLVCSVHIFRSDSVPDEEQVWCSISYLVELVSAGSHGAAWKCRQRGALYGASQVRQWH